jgi:hypothetical protein
MSVEIYTNLTQMKEYSLQDVAWNILLKLNIGCERFYLCRLFTIDWFKPEIVTVQYNSRTGISNVIFPGGRCK